MSGTTEAVTLRGAGTVLVTACPMLLLTNTVSGRRLFHKQSPEFCIECHTATILDGRIEFIGRVSSNTIRRDSLEPHKNSNSGRRIII